MLARSLERHTAIGDADVRASTTRAARRSGADTRFDHEHVGEGRAGHAPAPAAVTGAGRLHEAGGERIDAARAPSGSSRRGAAAARRLLAAPPPSATHPAPRSRQAARAGARSNG